MPIRGHLMAACLSGTMHCTDTVVPPCLVPPLCMPCTVVEPAPTQHFWLLARPLACQNTLLDHPEGQNSPFLRVFYPPGGANTPHLGVLRPHLVVPWWVGQRSAVSIRARSEIGAIDGDLRPKNRVFGEMCHPGVSLSGQTSKIGGLDGLF